MATNEAIMASNEAITSWNEGDVVELTEHDIPGARLTGAKDGYTMSELKWWLLCRGVKAPKSRHTQGIRFCFSWHHVG